MADAARAARESRRQSMGEQREQRAMQWEERSKRRVEKALDPFSTETEPERRARVTRNRQQVREKAALQWHVSLPLLLSDCCSY